MITADEITTAGGGKFQANSTTKNFKCYLFKSSSYLYWSLSPSYASGGQVGIFSVSYYSTLKSNTSDTSGALAPVINLSPKYANTLIGTGTMTDPYRAPGVEA